MQRRTSTQTPLALLWWGGYTIIAVWAQMLIPGVDFLAPGLVLAMQERPVSRVVVLGILWTLLQEGIGGLSFGYGVAWYGLLAIMFVLGRWMFESRSVMFMYLLGVFLGILHPLLTLGLLSLESMQTAPDRLIVEGAIQAAVFPVVWWFAQHFFPARLKADGASFQ